MAKKITGFSVRNDLDDVIEIKIWDNQYRPYYKRKARASDSAKIAEMLQEIKKAYGIDIVAAAAKNKKEIKWFE